MSTPKCLSPHHHRAECECAAEMNIRSVINRAEIVQQRDADVIAELEAENAKLREAFSSVYAAFTADLSQWGVPLRLRDALLAAQPLFAATEPKAEEQA